MPHAPSPRVTIPNLVALGQTVWASVGPKKLGDAGLCPLEMGVSDLPETTPSPRVTLSNLVALPQMIGE